METIVNEVRRTNDYSKFKTLKGNREIRSKTVKNLIDSINSVGWIMNPVIVNEKYEIIDGQHRFEALRTQERPIDFIIVEGLGEKECIQMNKYNTKWQMMDYIKHYAQLGDDSYQHLYDLTTQYKDLGLSAVYHAITGASNPDNNRITEGRFECTTEQNYQAIKILEYEKRFLPIVKSIPGSKQFYLQAVGFCYTLNNVDSERLYKKADELRMQLSPAGNLRFACAELDKVYNHHLGKKSKAYIEHEFVLFCDRVNGWYSSRHGAYEEKGKTF